MTLGLREEGSTAGSLWGGRQARYQPRAPQGKRRACGLPRQRRQPCANAHARHHEVGHGNGKIEPAWTCAAGIDIEHTVALVYERTMRMPGDHRVKARRYGIDVEAREVVNHVDARFPRTKYFRLPHLHCPGAVVVVAADRG